MFDNSAKANAATYRRRALMIVEAASSGLAIAEAAGHTKMAREFRQTLAWGNSLVAKSQGRMK